MKTLIVYATKHGSAEKCGNLVKNKLSGDVDLINLKKSSHIQLVDYDTIMIGGSIHAGKIQKRVKQFCQRNLQTLMQKKVGLFICCMEESEKAQDEFDRAFSVELRNHSSANGIFGGEFNFDRMNFIEKAIIKKVAHIDQSMSKISEEKIHRFVDQIKK